MAARKPAPPSDAEVAAALGPTRSLWDDLRRQLAEDAAPLNEDWVCSGAKHGWVLRLKRKDRALLYLKPLEKYFRASLALNPKAVALARARKLPAKALRMIDEAVQYPEGRAIRIEVRGPADAKLARQFAAVKLDA